MHLKILQGIGTYAPTLVDDKPVGIVQLPSIYELDNTDSADIDEMINTLGRGNFHKSRYDSLDTFLSYERYCVLEARLAKITKLYINDKKRTWFLFMDPIFMYKDGVPRYFTKDENQNVLYVSPSKDIGYTQMVVWTDQSSSAI
jgi:hypothetical protein